MKDKTSVSHDDVMIKKLRERPRFAAEYLKAAMEETDEPEVLLMALRHIAEARGGLAKVAKAAGIERESLYRALSARGESAAFDDCGGDEGGGVEVDGGDGSLALPNF
jgi:probable addiction module antidote protein